MFESDDFDQILSQFDYPEVAKAKPQETLISCTDTESQDFIDCTKETTTNTMQPQKVLSYIPNHKDSTVLKEAVPNNINNEGQELEYKKSNRHMAHKVDNIISPKHLKRKIISSHFDQQSKRKFPGPAGLLTGVLEGDKDESVGHIELLSQDVDFTENNLHKDLFDSPLWKRLLHETQLWKVNKVDSIKEVKQQAMTGNLRRRKAQTVTAFIEAIDRSVIDPLIILRDNTGSIKCTLHRDAWLKFSPYIVSEYCALVLQRPTVLTTGGAFKKHYLNITLSNILAIFSSAVLNGYRELPDGYRIVYEEDFTVIKSDICSDNEALESRDDENMFEGLENFFSDELF